MDSSSLKREANRGVAVVDFSESVGFFVVSGFGFSVVDLSVGLEDVGFMSGSLGLGVVVRFVVGAFESGVGVIVGAFELGIGVGLEAVVSESGVLGSVVGLEAVGSESSVLGSVVGLAVKLAVVDF